MGYLDQPIVSGRGFAITSPGTKTVLAPPPSDAINAAAYGLVSVAEFDFRTIAFPVGTTGITSNHIYVAGDVGKAIDVFSAGTNWGDLWTSITAFTAGAVNTTLTSVAVNGSNQVTILVSNTFVSGQQVTFSGVGTATFLNGVTLSIVSRTGSQIVCNAYAGDGTANPAFVHATYGPTADTGTITSQTCISVADPAISDWFDISNGKGYLVFGINANTGGFPSFPDCVPQLSAAIKAASAAGVGLFIPAGVFAYNSQIVIGPGGLDATDTMSSIVGSGVFGTNFVANNPDAATPMGFMTFSTLLTKEVRDFAIFGSSLAVGSQPTSPDFTVFAAVSQPPWAELTIWTTGDVGNIYLLDTPFTYGTHIRITQGTMYNVNDNGVAFVDLDGALANNCVGSAQVYSQDAPGILVGGGEGGIAVASGAVAFSKAHTFGLLAAVAFTGLASGNNNTMIFENCVTSNGPASLNLPIGFQVKECTMTNCTAEHAQIGYQAGTGTACYNNLADPDDTVACFTASEGQVPWTATQTYFGPGSAPVTSVKVEHAFAIPGIEGGTQTLLTIVAANSFLPGTPVVFSNLATATFLNYSVNGITFTVYTSSPTGFTAIVPTAVYDHANYGPTADTGKAIVGQYVVKNGFKQIVSVAGISGGSEPSWNGTLNGTTTDGGITWLNIGTFVDALATGITFADSAFNVASPATNYNFWNAANNVEFTALTEIAGNVPDFSSRSPIIMSGLTTTQTGLVVYALSSGVQRSLDVRYYLNTTTAGAAGTITPTFNWSDSGGNAQSFVGSTLDLSTVTGFLSGVLPITAKGATNVTVTLTKSGGAGAVYSAYIFAKRS